MNRNLPQTPTITNETLQLCACHHPVWHPDKRGGQLPVQHCYAKVVSRAGQTIDNISYDGPSGVSEATKLDQSGADCEIVRQITPKQ